MKHINNKYYIIGILSLFLGFNSCETLELDKTANPNALTPDQANVDFFLNSLQEDFVRQLDGDSDSDVNDNWQSGGSTSGDGLSLFGMELTRLQAMTNSNAQQYNGVYQASDSDDEWLNVYLGILGDIRAMTPLAEEAGLVHHIAIAQFIEAYVMTAMVDFYGDIPYSEAIAGEDNLNPALDSGASIYDASLALLDEAIANFEADASAEPAYDAFYGGDYEKWINAANTLKMRLYNQRRLVDPTSVASINTILSSGNYIASSADDFQFNWPATSATGPDTRHPLYGWDYRTAGANHYMSNWLMNFLDTTNDPRLRYYIYRQNADVPGSTGVPPNEEDLQCSLQAAPQHYIDGGFTFCYVDNGYWGRDHGDVDGIPPDGLKRALPGVYPCGGMFDDDRFTPAVLGSGGGGAGITPILTAAWVDLMQAEIAMVNSDAATAKIFLSAGLTKQIAKVQSFASVDSTADLSFEPSATDVSDFITTVEANFDAASTMEEKWDVFGEQFLVSVYGNGVEAYNFYRRTGYPTTLQPNRDPNPGVFVRSFLYPSNAVNTNSNINQKADVSQPVFWDTNASAPEAN